MKQTKSMEQKLYVNIKGEGSPVLMIHGIISDSTFFEETSEYLSEYYKVITYDRRGYGQSNEKEYTDYSVHVQAEDAIAILRENCSEPAWIIGNSAGGLIAVEAALCYPQLIKGLILIEPSLGYDEKERKKLLEWNSELNGYVKENKIKRALPAFLRVTKVSESKEKPVSLKELRQTYQNLSAFMYGELNEVQNYLPPIEKVRQLPMPVIVAVTENGRESIFATSSKTGAKIAGWPIVSLLGYHNVAKEMPYEFAVRMNDIICEYDTY